MKITHGLGGPKGILLLVITSVVGVVGILGVWLFRENLQSPPPAAAELAPDEVLRLAGKARGPMPEIPYIAKDLARVAASQEWADASGPVPTFIPPSREPRLDGSSSAERCVDSRHRGPFQP